MASLAAPLVPVDAAASVTGAAIFVCRATLPVFPAPSGAGICAAAAPVPGAALGVTAGVDAQGAEYLIAGSGTFSASFNYDETCYTGPPLPVMAVLGRAVGTATITGLTAVYPRTMLTSSATVRTYFYWVRYGAVGLVVLFSTRVDFGNGHLATSASPVSGVIDGVGLATFVPEPLPGTCAAPAPARIVVTGVGVVPV